MSIRSRRFLLTRRQFGVAALGAAGGLLAGAHRPLSLEHRGVLIAECSLPGESRADDVVPAHPNGIRVSRDRWLLVYATRGFRGVDDDLSIVYQLRRGSATGEILKEGFLARSRDDWDPLGDGGRYVRQFGHPVVFGVPRGARRAGKPLAHANLFAAKWRVVARTLDRKRNYLLHSKETVELRQRTQGVEWVQFRLNGREDDIEILTSPSRMRQKGYDSGPAFCEAESAAWMNQAFTPPVPLNADGAEWGDCNAFDGGRIAALCYRYDPSSRRYEWVRTGPFLGGPGRGIFEASLVPNGGSWMVGARILGRAGVAWTRTDDPFSTMPAVVIRPEPRSTAPRTVFACPDGAVRMLTGDQGRRDPLYMWKVDPDREFACTDRRVVFDSREAGLKIRPQSHPKVDMAKLLPPQGREQILVHRVSVRCFNHPYPRRPDIPVINGAEKRACGIYYARITYAESAGDPWELS